MDHDSIITQVARDLIRNSHNPGRELGELVVDLLDELPTDDQMVDAIDEITASDAFCIAEVYGDRERLLKRLRDAFLLVSEGFLELDQETIIALASALNAKPHQKIQLKALL